MSTYLVKLFVCYLPSSRECLISHAHAQLVAKVIVLYLIDLHSFFIHSLLYFTFRTCTDNLYYSISACFWYGIWLGIFICYERKIFLWAMRQVICINIRFPKAHESTSRDLQIQVWNLQQRIQLYQKLQRTYVHAHWG